MGYLCNVLDKGGGGMVLQQDNMGYLCNVLDNGGGGDGVTARQHGLPV